MDVRDALSSSDVANRRLQQTSVCEVDESFTVKQSNFQGEVKAFKRRHVLRSPQIVITCPADDFRQTFVCRACSSGPVCCADRSEETKDLFSVDRKMPQHDNGSDAVSDSDGNRTCSECGSTYSENSDWSSTSSENDQDYEACAASPIKKFTSIDNLNEANSELNFDPFSAQRSNCGSGIRSSSSSTSGNDDEDDEDVILVQIDRGLKDVVDNHIRSRKNSLNSSDAESTEDGRSLSPVKEMPKSKESEILQRFLQQVETHPQEEDLDVILEIVGEEDEEPCNRSKVNIRECTEKFKDIYAKKLKEIYHRKYRNSDFNTNALRHSQNSTDLSDFESRSTPGKVGDPVLTSRISRREHSKPSELASNSSVNGTTSLIMNSTLAIRDSQRLNENSKLSETVESEATVKKPESHLTDSELSKEESKSCRPKLDDKQLGSKFVRKTQMMIDKLPEIRQFHPENIDPKIPLEDRTYLKATSLINEIESCFKETAFLVEKSIGSNRSPVFVLRSDVETQKLHSNSDLFENSDPPCTKYGMKDNFIGKSTLSCSLYENPRTERILNEYQSIWNSVESDLPSPIHCREPDDRQNDFLGEDMHQLSADQHRQISGENIKNYFTFDNNIGYDSDNRCSNAESRTTSDFIAGDTNQSALDNTQIDFYEGRRSDAKCMKDEFNFQNKATRTDTERIPRTLEESIEIFETILGDRTSESRKSYDSGLSSSTLVLNSSKFLKENSIESSERCSKYNSTNDLFHVSDDDHFNHTWTLGRNRNRFKSAFHLGDKYTTRNYLSRPKWSSDISNSSDDHLRDPSPEIGTNQTEMSFQNTYKKFDSFDLFSDFDHQVVSKNDRCRSKNTTNGRREAIGSHHRFDERGVTKKSNFKAVSKNSNFSILNYHKAADRNWGERLSSSLQSSQWKSEPDFGKLTFPSFGFQSSSSEQYYDKDYLSTSITTSSIKNNKFGEDTIKHNQAYRKENDSRQKENFSRTTENVSASISSGTMGILNEQPLFAQVDELLKGLCESRVDSSSESDEGVVSDQSDASEFNQSEKHKCASVSEIMDAIEGSNGDEELEKNIEQIVHGINSIKERHLGRKIEEELENYIRPKIELLRENISTNLRTSTASGRSSNAYPVNTMTKRKHSIEREAADLSEKIKKLAELPEIRDVITKMNHQSTTSLWKLQVSNELKAMEQISQISDELKSLCFATDELDMRPNFMSNLQRSRCSRKEEYEKQSAIRRVQRSNDHVHVTKTSTRSSSCFSFFEDPDSGEVSDLSDCHTGNVRQRRRERSPSDTNESADSKNNRNSFIMKMLHQNLRCYVITLAFLEKLLNGDVSNSESTIGDRSKFFENFSLEKSEMENSGFAALEKAMSMLPGIAEHNTTSCGPPPMSPFDIGHQAFLQGLRRQHLVETQQNSLDRPRPNLTGHRPARGSACAWRRTRQQETEKAAHEGNYALYQDENIFMDNWFLESFMIK